MSSKDQIEDSDSFEFLGENEEDSNDDIDLIEIQLLSNIVEIRFSQLIKYSQYARKKFSLKTARDQLSELFCEYEENYGIQEKNIILFIKFIEDKKCEIDESSFFDLCKLASLFKVFHFNNILQKFEKQNLTNIQFISKLLLNKKTMEKFDLIYDDEIINEIETNLASKINECILNEDFNRLPNSIILNVFEKSDKKIIDSNLLYDFIKKSIDERHNLLLLIDIDKLSDEFIEDIHQNYLEEQKNSDHDYFQKIGNSIESHKLIRAYAKNKESKEKLLVEKRNQAKIELEKLQDKVNKLEILREDLLNEKDNLDDQLLEKTNENKKLKSQMIGKAYNKKEIFCFQEIIKGFIQKTGSKKQIRVLSIS